ncbi:MAG: glycine/D-amino acid oxidase-like deaminating enzyme [Gammaproteobacteria bacterium]|jgi:glycine/D-amino acid oxidase-like deaminating enzyme
MVHIPSAPLPEHADVVILGAGYAGLNAALDLARSGLSVCVLSAHDLSWLAHSQGIGSVAPSASLVGALCTAPNEIVPGQSARLAACTQMYDRVESAIANEAFACGFERSGQFFGAVTRDHLSRLSLVAAHLESADDLPDVGAVVLDEGAQWQETGSAFYCGGLLIPKAGQFNAVSYFQGMQQACEQAGATLSGNAPISAVERTKNGWQISSGDNTVSTRDVVVTEGSYQGPLLAHARTFATNRDRYAIAMEPLSPDLLKVLLPNDRALAETARMGYELSLAPSSGRLIFRGTANIGVRSPAQAAPVLYEHLRERFPHLRGARVTRAWAYSNSWPAPSAAHTGCEQGVYYCAGHDSCDAGTQIYIGKMLADFVMAAPHDSRAPASVQVPAQWRSPTAHAFRALADQNHTARRPAALAQLRTAYAMHLDRRERRRDTHAL